MAFADRRAWAFEPTKADPISVRMPDAVRLTGLSRSKMYQLIAAGDIETAKVGRSTVILVQSLREFIQSKRVSRR
ncbi:MAG: helix-turn-helix domain-containing protein [Sphingopyxis sp.]|nr:helix-turn-helix domain-containing protein [Sphingopyxis sp.]